MTDMTARQKYDFKRTLEEIMAMRGQHTELISLYVPPTKQISDVVAYLRNEYSQSSNIKSKTTKNNVMGAIDSIMSRLKHYRQPPESGLVFFVGEVITGNNQTTMTVNVIEPPQPITTFSYRCDSTFNIEPLSGMMVEKEVFGMLLIDRRECTIGILRGKKIELKQYMTSQVPGKHGRGGQSQKRFERLTEIAAHDWFIKCGEVASGVFMAEENLKGIFIGGPGPTKRVFSEGGFLHYTLEKHIVDLFDTGYTDEFGLKELATTVTGSIQELSLTGEKELMRRLLREIQKEGGGLSVYGENEVRHALELGAVETLLMSENLRTYRLLLKCPECGYSEKKTVREMQLCEGWQPLRCEQCANKPQMTVAEKVDIIDELSELAEASNAKVELISPDSEEGEILSKAFGGIAGILRYKLG